MTRYVASLLGLVAVLPALNAQPPTPVPPGTPVTITVVPGAPPAPTVSIRLGPRHGHATPYQRCCCHTGGGITDVAQPSPDTLVITMTAVAVAVGSPCSPGVAQMDFDLDQEFEVVFEKPEVKAAKLSVEGRVIGFLRSHGRGTAEESAACAAITCAHGDGPTPELVRVCAPAHSVAGNERLSINDRDGPVCSPIVPACYHLHQTFHIMAATSKAILPCKGPSAEFAPDPALDPLWISYWEPFHGAIKKDLGFQVTIKVAEETVNAANSGSNGSGPAKGDERLPEPKGQDKKPK
jgi:hypothetical protein